MTEERISLTGIKSVTEFLLIQCPFKGADYLFKPETAIIFGNLFKEIPVDIFSASGSPRLHDYIHVLVQKTKRFLVKYWLVMFLFIQFVCIYKYTCSVHTYKSCRHHFRTRKNYKLFFTQIYYSISKYNHHLVTVFK